MTDSLPPNEQGAESPKPTPADLESMATYFAMCGYGCEFIALVLASQVLKAYLGFDWTRDTVFGKDFAVCESHQGGRKLLTLAHSGDEDEDIKNLQRVVHFAECIMNLRHAEGLGHRLAVLQVDDLEGALGEMWCASLFGHPDQRFKFVVPANEKGRYCEGQFVINGQTIHCEIKTKKQTTEPSDSTVWQSLETGRKQLPKGKPGVIILKIPDSWVNPVGENAVTAAVRRIFRQSQRVVAVIVAWGQWTRLEGEGWHWAFIDYFYFNHKSPFYSQDFANDIVSAQYSNANSRLVFSVVAAQAIERVSGAHSQIIVIHDPDQLLDWQGPQDLLP